MRMFFAKRAAPKPVDTVNAALRGGVSCQRYRISKADAQRVKDAEKSGGHQAGLACLLRILAAPKV